MDATELDFEDERFDLVMSVEAAFHFNTREKFLREALRVLRPNGWLTLSDILVARWMEVHNPSRTPENYVEGLKEYREVFVRAGFDTVRVLDKTRECSTRFYEELSRHVWRARRADKIDEDRFQRINRFIGWSMLAQRHYVLVWARKAGGPS
jgi:ubiquinone/menaquinone biosynthesis C-methylase UbiE